MVTIFVAPGPAIDNGVARWVVAAICLSVQRYVEILTSLVRCVILELKPSFLTVLLQLETLLYSLCKLSSHSAFCSLPVQQASVIPGNPFSQSKPMTAHRTMAFLNTPITARTQILVHSWVPRTMISALFRRLYYPGLDCVCGAGYE